MSRRALFALPAAALLLAACQASPPPEVAADFADADVVLVGNNQLQWENPDPVVPAGEVVIGLQSNGSVNHNVLLEGVLDDQPIAEAGGNAESAGVVTLDPGEYTYYCSIPGHRAAGMVGTFTVTE